MNYDVYGDLKDRLRFRSGVRFALRMVGGRIPSNFTLTKHGASWEYITQPLEVIVLYEDKPEPRVTVD